MAIYSDSYFEPDCSIGYLARRIYQLSSEGLEPVFAPEGLTLTQWSALVSIYFGRGNTSADLARDLAHDKGATTRLVDTLVERGWVTRDRDAADRRVINLALTPTGAAVARQCRAKVIDCWNGWLGDWQPAAAAELVRLLQDLRATLERHVSPGPSS